MRVGVHENQPVAGGRRRAGIAGAANLVERLEHHFCARRAGDLAGAVGGIVVADDEFKFPAASGERRRRRFNFCERGAEEFFLVERGDDDGDFHAQDCKSKAQSPKPKVIVAGGLGLWTPDFGLFFSGG